MIFNLLSSICRQFLVGLHVVTWEGRRARASPPLLIFYPMSRPISIDRPTRAALPIPNSKPANDKKVEGTAVTRAQTSISDGNRNSYR